jgi:hypothetical protein
MICYRDMTFCKFYEDCKNGKECNRALTPDILDGAEKWFGKKNAPICQFVNKPNCFKQMALK